MARKFPYLDEHERFRFPPESEWTPEGIVGIGGNLSPGMLLSAYSQGIFPWYSPGEPITWWSPEPRFVLFPERLHVAHSMHKVFNSSRFTVSADRQFRAVIGSCQSRYRPGQNGTWITEEMLEAYVELHRLGYAHSVEVMENGKLVGGLYGVSLGSCFFGESMFSHVTNASKVGFITLVRALVRQGLRLIDSQVYTRHLESLGAQEIPRTQFIETLRAALSGPSIVGEWDQYLKPLPPMNSRSID